MDQISNSIGNYCRWLQFYNNWRSWRYSNTSRKRLLNRLFLRWGSIYYLCCWYLLWLVLNVNQHPLVHCWLLLSSRNNMRITIESFSLKWCSMHSWQLLYCRIFSPHRVSRWNIFWCDWSLSRNRVSCVLRRKSLCYSSWIIFDYDLMSSRLLVWTRNCFRCCCYFMLTRLLMSSWLDLTSAVYTRLLQSKRRNYLIHMHDLPAWLILLILLHSTKRLSFLTSYVSHRLVLCKHWSWCGRSLFTRLLLGGNWLVKLYYLHCRILLPTWWNVSSNRMSRTVHLQIR